MLMMKNNWLTDVMTPSHVSNCFITQSQPKSCQMSNVSAEAAMVVAAAVTVTSNQSDIRSQTSAFEKQMCHQLISEHLWFQIYALIQIVNKASPPSLTSTSNRC